MDKDFYTELIELLIDWKGSRFILENLSNEEICGYLSTDVLLSEVLQYFTKEEIIDYISSEYHPSTIYTSRELKAWANEEGYVESE